MSFPFSRKGKKVKGSSEPAMRSLMKAFSWRFFATGFTALLVWFATSRLDLAFSIGAAEAVGKLLLYYFHERLWAHVPLGSKGNLPLSQAQGDRNG